MPVRDARRFGASDEDIAEIRAALDGPQGEGVFPDNVAAVEAFLIVATQWRSLVRETMDGIRIHFTGLDYAAARAGLELAGVAVEPRVWRQVLQLEATARDALNGMAG